MVAGTYEGRPLSVDEMLGLSATILVGGLDTVAALLGSVARYLAENPQSRQMLREGDVKMNAAIDEFLRRYPPTTSGRQVVDDEIGRAACRERVCQCGSIWVGAV